MSKYLPLVRLYEGLASLELTVGALVGHAVAMAAARGVAQGWALLQAIPAEAEREYQPYRALAAHLPVRLQRLATPKPAPCANTRSASAKTLRCGCSCGGLRWNRAERA
ncbi:MAG TPA: hypothetical protein VF738_05085 [Rhodanobacter sp.]